MIGRTKRPLVRRRDDPLGGLPARLPEGERVLWQGRPDASLLALRALHVRKIAVYLAIMLAWFTISDFSVAHWQRTVAGILCLALAGAAAIGLLCGFAVLLSRSTIYTLTDRRVVLRFGVALTMSVNLPLVLVENADLRRAPDGSGDVILRMSGRQTLGYALLWPHARPWRFSRPEPMLRAVRDVSAVAALLSEALAHTVPEREASVASGESVLVKTPSPVMVPA